MRFLCLFNKEIAETVEMMCECSNPDVVYTSKAEAAFAMKSCSPPELFMT